MDRIADAYLYIDAIADSIADAYLYIDAIAYAGHAITDTEYHILSITNLYISIT
jgi:hypothetical protein